MSPTSPLKEAEGPHLPIIGFDLHSQHQLGRLRASTKIPTIPFHPDDKQGLTDPERNICDGKKPSRLGAHGRLQMTVLGNNEHIINKI